MTMDDKRQNFIIGMLAVIIVLMLGFWGASYFQSEPIPADETIPASAIEVVPGHPRTLFDGYISEISPITREMKIIVGLDMFVNPPEAVKEVTVSFNPDTTYRILFLPEKIEGVDDRDLPYTDMPASFEDFRVLDDVSVSMAGDITDLLRNETITVRELTRLD